jgi:hypothetical protein
MPYFPIGPPMPRPWGPSLMKYPPCSPWEGWYSPWTPPPMQFHLGWLGPAGGFCHRGYHIGDGHYRGVVQQQIRQKNQTIWNAKPDHPVSPKTIETPEQPHKQSVQRMEDARSFGGSQDQEGPKSETLANDDKAKHNKEIGLDKVAEKYYKAQGEETHIRAKTVANS